MLKHLFNFSWPDNLFYFIKIPLQAVEMPRPLQTVACLHQQNVYVLGSGQGKLPLLCFSPQKQPLQFPSPCFNGRLCLYMIRSNRRPFKFIGSLRGRCCLLSALSVGWDPALCLLDTGAQRLTGLCLVGLSQVTDVKFGPFCFSISIQVFILPVCSRSKTL